MKKLLLILTFLTTSLFSFQVDIWQEGDNAILNFNKYYDNVGGDEGTNWVAIYKEGSSNDWDNVITWAWAKDLAHNEAGNYDERVLPLVTDGGSYEVRFFLNNSYDVFKHFSYSNGGGNNNNASLEVTDKNSNSITFNNTTANEAWIGIYKKGDSNDWDNVKAWSWATGVSTTIDIANLPSGTYEARLFYNNSYHVETKVEFTKEGEANNEANIEIQSQTTDTITFNSTDADQAWIGIYTKGDSNEWENVKAWDWVNNPTTIDISNLSNGTYEARLFYNNSYHVEKTVEFTKDGGNGNGYPQVTREELDAMIANGEDYSKVDVSGITDMSGLFENKEVKFDITGWDVSNVTDMSKMFDFSESFNQDISNWDVSKVANMYGMFWLTKTFNQPIGDWDVSNVTDMSYMFDGAQSFNQPIGNWDVSNVTNMYSMFFESNFDQPIGSWNVSNVIYMGHMFYASSFNQPIGDWDVSNVTNMNKMFYRAYEFNQDIGSWDVSNVIYMGGMFERSLKFDQDISNWNVDKVEEHYHFSYESALHQYYIPSFKN